MNVNLNFNVDESKDVEGEADAETSQLQCREQMLVAQKLKASKATLAQRLSPQPTSYSSYSSSTLPHVYFPQEYLS